MGRREMTKKRPRRFGDHVDTGGTHVSRHRFFRSYGDNPPHVHVYRVLYVALLTYLWVSVRAGVGRTPLPA